MSIDQFRLLSKYDVAVPRYTSYPTVPSWDFQTIQGDNWKSAVIRSFKQENQELCIYIHLPFCEELCTYCACNKRITKNHAVEIPYLESVLAEWEMYRALLADTPVIREIHLGGGTPTFFSPEHLKQLINGITKHAIVANDHAFSVEVHPNYTNEQHLVALQEVGFNRISLGVQDFDPVVQFIINRPQTFEQTQHVIKTARALGFTGVNIDLIYGLPKQTNDSIKLTMDKVKELMPDRIAFYSYAHVPWKSKGQRRYTDEDVPVAEEKLQMYQTGSAYLHQLGFSHIGMDHFALPTDALMLAYQVGKLHRNFMGYTTTNHKLVIGLGASAISDTWDAFAQNEKGVEAYQDAIASGRLPIINGHNLNETDQLIRKHILDLMCRDTTTLVEEQLPAGTFDAIMERLSGFVEDGLISIEGGKISILPSGRLFIRNICSAIDLHLHSGSRQGNTFSKAI